MSRSARALARHGSFFSRMVDTPDFLPAHCRGARALLDWTQAQLAERAEVGRMTVKRFEAGEPVRPAQAAAIRLALQRAGARFMSSNAVLEDEAVELGVALSKEAGVAPDRGDRADASSQGGTD